MHYLTFNKAEKYRPVFSGFTHFNLVQSRVFDDVSAVIHYVGISHNVVFCRCSILMHPWLYQHQREVAKQ